MLPWRVPEDNPFLITHFANFFFSKKTRRSIRSAAAKCPRHRRSPRRDRNQFHGQRRRPWYCFAWGLASAHANITMSPIRSGTSGAITLHQDCRFESESSEAWRPANDWSMTREWASNPANKLGGNMLYVASGTLLRVRWVAGVSLLNTVI